jgi:uncharacterized membrane protein
MPEPGIREADGVLTTSRIETLADGIFAIVMTLLVFNLKVPEILAGTSMAELPTKLFQLWPKLLSYVISFAVTGVYWIAHHNQFYYIKRSDRWLLWINILFLMFVALTPFSSALLGEYPSTQVAVVVYGINLTLNRLTLFLNWWYATKNNRLVNPDLDPYLVKLFTRRILAAPFFYGLAIVFSFVSTDLSILLYALVTVYYILPGRIDREWMSVETRDETTKD